jgi:phage I-like protein
MKTSLYCQIGSQLPELIRLFSLGEVILGDGRPPFQVTQESLENIMAAWKRRGNDMVIDYEHQTATGQEAPAAGWIKELLPGSDGLWARVVWTDRAREYLEKREYRYFSPVVQLGEGRVVEDLLHVALTNFPAMTNIDPLILQNQATEDSRSARLWKKRSGEKKERKLEGNESGEIRGEDMIIAELRTIFGFQDDASEAQILAMINDLVKTKEPTHTVLPMEIIKSLELKEEDSPVEAVDRIETLKAEADRTARLEEEISVLKDEQLVRKAELLIQEALSSQKITPAELDLANGRLRRMAQEDPDCFQDIILSRHDNWAVPGPLNAGTRPNFLSLTREERTICETFGLTQEAFIKNRASFEKGE